MKLFSFEKLIVWKKSKTLTVKIYEITKIFPDNERFGLVSQIRRSSISIVSNIAEGSGRHSNKDKARFTEIAFGSALELLNQIILSNTLNYITQEDYKQIRTDISEITAMLNSLYKAQLNK